MFNWNSNGFSWSDGDARFGGIKEDSSPLLANHPLLAFQNDNPIDINSVSGASFVPFNSQTTDGGIAQYRAFSLNSASALAHLGSAHPLDGAELSHTGMNQQPGHSGVGSENDSIPGRSDYIGHATLGASEDYGIDTAIKLVDNTTSVGTTGDFQNQDINGLLSGVAWNTTSLTYSFPTSVSNYGDDYGDPAPGDGFAVLSTAQQDVVRYALGLVSQYTPLTFTEITETDTAHATLRFSDSDYPPTSYAYYPSNNDTGGDAFYGNIADANPTKAGYEFDTIMHEIGHTLGLKHGQDDDGTHGTLPDDHNSTEWSIMDYHSYVGADLYYRNPEGSGNQTYMVDDIAALQYMYGANFNTHSENTVYTWSPTTGEEFINGVGQAASSTDTVYEAIWDGNGNDTYDLSNYTTNLSINLNPGEWSTFSMDQVAYLDSSDSSIRAPGNIDNANEYNNDPHSLIENAIGGSGNDTIIGNVADNMLNGGGGTDTLEGGAGNDTYIVNNTGVTIIENAGEGTDTVQTLLTSYTLGTNVENLTYTGTASFSGTGNDAINVITGGTGNDTLSGGASADILNGGGGTDTLIGGTGSDTYIVNNTGVTITEETNGGAADTVKTSLSSYTLPTNVENLVYTGTGSFTGTGNSGDNVITGGGGTDSLNGGTGNDTLNGGAGSDTLNAGSSGTDHLSGGTGSDTYIIDHAGVTVTENSGEGSADMVQTSLSTYTLSAYVENLVYTGTGNFTGTGNDLANTIQTGTGDDVIHGGAGNDVIISGDGADKIYAGTGTDVIDGGTNNDLISFTGGQLTAADKIDGGTGTDEVYLNSNYTGANAVVMNSTTMVNVELLRMANGNSYDITTNDATVAAGQTLTVDASALTSSHHLTFDGSAETNGNFSITGSDGADTITTGSGNDVVDGGGSSDVIHTGAGNDTIDGGSNADKIYAGTGTDVIDGGTNNDLISFTGGQLTAADKIDGGTGTDEVYLNSNYTGANAVVFSATTMVNVELLRMANGNSYDITTNDATVAAGKTLTVDASALTSSHHLTFDGSAETNGNFSITGSDGADTITTGSGNDVVDGGGSSDVIHTGAGNDTIDGGSNADKIYAGTGTDVIDGGTNNDLISFTGGQLTAADKIDGGTGTDEVYLNSNYTGANQVIMNSTTMVNVELIRMANGNSYHLTTASATVASGATLTVDASALSSSHVLIFDGSAETNGHFVFQPGDGSDTLTGGSQSDTFDYATAAQSTSTHYDTINAFNFASDKFDVTGTISKIDTGVSHAISTASFDTDIAAAASASHLAAGSAMLVTATSGTLSGDVFLVIDQNGTAGYQAGHDLVINLHAATGTLATSDFI